MLDDLAESGHVERARSETDRRVVVSRLTPLGPAPDRGQARAWQGRWERALAGVSDARAAAATRVLERLGAMFEDAAPGCGTREEALRQAPLQQRLRHGQEAPLEKARIPLL